MKKIFILVILFEIPLFFGIGFWSGNKQRVFEKCPVGQVLISHECFTPGQYYTTGLPRR